MFSEFSCPSCFRTEPLKQAEVRWLRWKGGLKPTLHLNSNNSYNSQWIISIITIIQSESFRIASLRSQWRWFCGEWRGRACVLPVSVSSVLFSVLLCFNWLNENVKFNRFSFRVFQIFRAFRVSEEIEPQMFADKSRWDRLYFHNHQWIFSDCFTTFAMTLRGWSCRGRACVLPVSVFSVLFSVFCVSNWPNEQYNI